MAFFAPGLKNTPLFLQSDWSIDFYRFFTLADSKESWTLFNFFSSRECKHLNGKRSYKWLSIGVPYLHQLLHHGETQTKTFLLFLKDLQSIKCTLYISTSFFLFCEDDNRNLVLENKSLKNDLMKLTTQTDETNINLEKGMLF